MKITKDAKRLSNDSESRAERFSEPLAAGGKRRRQRGSKASLGPCERAMRGATRRESEAALPPRAARKQNLSHRESSAFPSSRALRARAQLALSNPSRLLALSQSPRLI